MRPARLKVRDVQPAGVIPLRGAVALPGGSIEHHAKSVPGRCRFQVQPRTLRAMRTVGNEMVNPCYV